MKNKFLAILMLFALQTLNAATPTTGQFLFQRKAASGPFTQFGVTPVTNQVFGWDGTNVVMMGAGGGVTWGSITGTLSNQTDLQTTLNTLQVKTGTLALGGFGSITGTLADARLSANVQLKDGTLALDSFGSVTGTLAAARLPATAQTTNGTLALAGFGGITGTIGASNLPATAQTTNGTLALAGFGSITGTVPGANGGLGQSNSFVLGDLVIGASGSATRFAGNTTATKKFLSQTGNGTISANPVWGVLALGDIPSGVLLASNNLSDVADVPTALNNLLPSQTGNSGKVLGTNGTTHSWVSPSGTVSSVALTAPGVFSVSGSPVTTSGTLALSLATQTANLVWAGPTTGSAAIPTFRALVAADIPDISATYLTLAAGAAAYQPLDADLTAIAALSGTNNIYYRSGAGTWTSVTVGTGLSFSAGTLSNSSSATVSSVALALPSVFSVSGSPVTSSGTLTGSLATQTANTVWSGPTTGSAATPTFRPLVAADIPDVSATYLTVSAAAAGYQPLDADLTAFAALTGTNNMYYRSGVNTWSNVSFGTGLSFAGGTLSTTLTGTVTSVALTLPNIFALSGSPITTSGTFAATLANQSANRVWAGPTTGAATTPAFRALVAADIPDISATYLTLAAAAAAYQPLDADLTALAALSGTNNIYYRSAANTWTSVTMGTGITFAGGALTPDVNLGANIFTGRQSVSANGASGASPVKLTGTWFSGGGATNTKPQLLIEPTGTTSTGWQDDGTALGINAASGFVGELADFQTNGVSVFRVGSGGTLAVNEDVIAVGKLLSGDNVETEGDIVATTIGKTLKVQGGANAKAGTFTLVAGAATVSNTSITANSVVLVTVKTVGGVRTGNPDIVPTASTGFAATGLVTDTSTYNYVILEVVP